MINRTNLKKIFNILFVMIAIAFMAYYLHKNWAQLQNYDWNFDWKLILVSCFLLWIAFASSTVVSRLVFNDLAGAKFSFWQMFRIGNLANVGRYLPGKLWSILGLYYMTAEYGVSKSRTTLAVITNEVCNKGSALLVGLCYFFFSPSYRNLIPFMIAMLAGLLIIVHPRILNYFLNKLLKMLKKQPTQISSSYGNIIKYMAMFCIVWVLHSLAFWVFVNAITSTAPINIVHFFTIMPLCWIIGYLMIFAPGGIGVREGMLVVMLGEFLPSEVALVIAISQRIWFILLEGINALIATMINPGYKQAKTDMDIKTKSE